jgi:glutamate decarboxylase
MTREVPKYKFPPEESPPREAYQVVADELMLDGNARQNLATFCQTWAEPELLALMALAVHKNLIDKDEYPQTAEIEARCVHMLADLWNVPDAGNAVGASAIGSSEACMLAGMAAKWRWRAKRRARRQAEHGVRPGAGGVAQVRQVLGHRDARGPDVAWPLHDGSRLDAGAG